MIKTKKEAIKLQNKIDNILVEALNEETTTISMALSGRIKIQIEGNFLCLNRDGSIEYIRYIGNYDNFLDNYDIIKKVINENKNDIDLLMESYENISKLI